MNSGRKNSVNSFVTASCSTSRLATYPSAAGTSITGKTNWSAKYMDL